MRTCLYVLLLCMSINSHAQYIFTGIDVFAGASNSSNPSNLTHINGKLFFSATTSTTGTELYAIDSPYKQSNLMILKDIFPGTSSSSPGDFTVYDGSLYFTADDGLSGRELWKSDGTASGTQLMIDVLGGGVSSNPRSLCVMGGKLYFVATTIIDGEELWVTDGTLVGTNMVKDIRSGAQGSNITSLFAYNDTLYFSADDGSGTGNELWKSDGTAGGTVLVKDIAPGLFNSNPLMFTVLNGKLYFVATTQANGEEWWTTDGTSAGTKMIIDIASGGGSGVQSINKFAIVFNNAIYFNGGPLPLPGMPLTTGQELYKTDGTVAGTMLVKEITPGNSPTVLNWPIVMNNKLYFTADEVGVSGNELWSTDGTTAGTAMVSDIISGSTSSSPTHLTTFNNKLFFSANNAPMDRQLFLTDGTASGTMMLKPSGGLADGLNLSVFNGFSIVGSQLFYSANYDTKNGELWYVKDTSTTTVNRLEIDDVVNIYPNPSNGSFTIGLDNVQYDRACVTVSDMMGKEVYRSAFVPGTKAHFVQLNTAAGLYWIKLQLDDKLCYKKIVVE